MQAIVNNNDVTIMMETLPKEAKKCKRDLVTVLAVMNLAKTLRQPQRGTVIRIPNLYKNFTRFDKDLLTR